MAYLPELHYCCYCKEYLGPDDGDGICCACEASHCSECGAELAHNNKSGVCWNCSGRHQSLVRLQNDKIGAMHDFGTNTESGLL